MYRGDAEGILETADRLGTRLTAMMSWGGPIGGDMRHDNDIVAEAMRRHPGKVAGLVYVNPTHHTKDELLAELRLRVDGQGFVGIKPYIHVGVSYDAPLWQQCWEFGEARGLYALLHTGGKAGNTQTVRNVAQRHPSMSFLVAHTGGSWEMARETAAVMRDCRNVFAELTLTPVTNGVIEWLAREVGDDRILYGTDAPMRDPRPQFGWVAWARLPEASRRNILGRNFEALLSRVREAKAAFCA
jgi:predicted TIM-barrel fold metal-dependent hydrolase